MKGKHYVFMDDNAGAAGGGSAPAGGVPAAGGAPAAGAAPAGAGAGTPAAASAQPTPGAGAGAASSALSAGQDGAADGGAGGDAGAATPWGFIPEKFQVKNAAGELDGEASARKVEEHRASLEKRLGEGGIRPKTAAEYKLPELPEALKDAALDDAVTAKFKEDAHKAGFSQAQFEFAMGKYFELAPQLVNAGQTLSAEDTVAELKTAWGKDYSANAANAWRGVTQIAQLAGLTVAQVESELGNSPAFNRIMAAVGAQLREDTAPNPGGMSSGGDSTTELAALQASEAFRNPRHPDHATVTAKWSKLATKGVVDAPIV